MVKRTYVDGDGLRKGAWTNEEDDKLRAYVNQNGHSNWRLLPRFAGLDRCGKSCRLRWMNYLKPGVRRGGYSDEERDLITRLHHQHGNKWSIMSSKLPGRTDNEIKNFYNAHIKKRLKAAPLTEKAEIVSSGGTDLVNPAAPKLPSSELFVQDSTESNSTIPGIPSPVELGSDSSMERNCSDASSVSSGATGIDDNGFSDLLFPGFDDEFWTQPFMVDTDSYDGCEVFSSFLCMWLNDVNNSSMF